MTERKAEPNREEEVPSPGHLQANQIARNGLADASDNLATGAAPEATGAPAETSRVSERALTPLLAIMDRHRDGISERRLFYELFGQNKEDATTERIRSFNTWVRALRKEEIIKRDTRSQFLVRTDGKLSPVGGNPAARERAERLTIPPTFREDVQALLAQYEGKLHVTDVITALFPHQSMSGENYRLVLSTLRGLVDSGMMVYQGDGQYVAPSQPDREESGGRLPSRPRKISQAQRDALDRMIQKAGIGPKSQPVSRPRPPVRKTHKR